MTPPNTELKSAEEWTIERDNMPLDYLIGESDEVRCKEFANFIRSIQHNAMLAMAEEAMNVAELAGLKQATRIGALAVRNKILTRAEQILKGEK